MSDLVEALRVELADILGVTPGHSMTGDYAALRGDAERLAAVVEAHTAELENEIARLRSINAELTNDAQCARDDQSFNLVCTIAAVLCDAEHGNGDMDGAMPHFDLAGRILDAGAVGGHLQARENRISEMAEQIGDLKHALARTRELAQEQA